jgi:hypothetical protein
MTSTTETAGVTPPSEPNAGHLAQAPDFLEANEDPEQSAELELQQDA